MSWMRDPTAETSPVKRARRAPPKSLEGLTVGLFDIGKTRTPEFLDQVEKRFNEKGIKTKRTSTGVASPAFPSSPRASPTRWRSSRRRSVSTRRWSTSRTPSRTARRKSSGRSPMTPWSRPSSYLWAADAAVKFPVNKSR
jgi:hypothetical protein